MSPFDRQPITFYRCSIVTMALSRVVSEIFNVENYPDLEIAVKGQSRSLNMLPFNKLDMVSY